MAGLFRCAGVALPILVSACNRAPPPATPKPDPTRAVQTGVASFYARRFAGRETASGERLKLNAMTAASRTLPLGARVQVVNAETGQSAKVTINDRGPYVGNRLLDVTPKAARAIGIDRKEGLARVRVKAIPTGETAMR